MEKAAEGEPRLKAVGTTPVAARQHPCVVALQSVLVVTLVFGGGSAFLYLFSDLPMCKGPEVFVALSGNYHHELKAVLSAVGFGFVLVLVDVGSWHGLWKVVARGLVFLAVLLFGTTALLAAQVFHIGPTAFFLLGAPFLLMGLKSTLLRSMPMVTFLRTLSRSLGVVSCVSLGLWLGWIFRGDHFWGLRTRVRLFDELECRHPPFGPGNATLFNETLQRVQANQVGDEIWLLPDEREVLEHGLRGCSIAFLMWIHPLVLCLWSAIFALVTFLIKRVLVQAAQAEDKAHAMDPLTQLITSAIVLGLFGMWAAAGIAGAEMNLTNIVLALIFVGFIVLAVVVLAVFGSKSMQSALGSTPLGQRVLKSIGSDWAKAVLLILVLPLFVLYLPVSVVRQLARKYLVCTRRLDEEERRLVLTVRTSRNLRAVVGWNWTSVLVKTLWLGVLFFLISVGIVRLATLCLSWMNQELLEWPLAQTTGIFFLVGVAMFLNPFVPGVPVYLAGGVILVNSAMDRFGYWPAVAYAVLQCFLIKMVAIVLQQKVIGELYASRKPWIRRLVGVNSVEIRAMRRILLQPGLDFRKVCVLCGCPDWPISVLTGILHLPLCSMLLGSLPVILLVLPTTMAGALLLQKGDIWRTSSSIMLLAAGVAQGVAIMAALHFVAKTIVEHEEELRSEPDDEEVKELERRSAKRSRLREEITRWENLGGLDRAMLIFSSLCMVSSCYMFQLLGGRCFRSFKVYDNINDKLDGNALNIIKPLGVVACSLFAYPMLYLLYFRHQVERKVRQADAAAATQNLAVGALAGDLESDAGSESLSKRRSAGSGASSATPPPTLLRNKSELEIDRRVCSSILLRNIFFCLDSKGN